MISAVTGEMALLMVTLVNNHGLEHLLAATLLCGVFQIAAGCLKLGSLMRFASRSVVTGFVNALAILIFMAPGTHAMTTADLSIIYQLPYIPSSSWPVAALQETRICTSKRLFDLDSLYQRSI